jgi:hypothetical protein
MTMSEALFNIAPNTTKMFASWLMENYGMSLKEFEKKTPQRKHFEVSKFFGYQLIQHTEKSVTEIIAFIKEVFVGYEQLINKYPDGVPNFLKQLKEMPNDQRTGLIQKHYIRDINISLCHSVIKGNNIVRVSLCDAIKQRILTRIELESKIINDKKIIDEQFWINTIKNFIPDEIVPF